jgi:hypothetical protein
LLSSGHVALADGAATCEVLVAGELGGGVEVGSIASSGSRA